NSFFFFSSRRRHTSFSRDWSSDVCSSDLSLTPGTPRNGPESPRGFGPVSFGSQGQHRGVKAPVRTPLPRARGRERPVSPIRRLAPEPQACGDVQTRSLDPSELVESSPGLLPSLGSFTRIPSDL